MGISGLRVAVIGAGKIGSAIASALIGCGASVVATGRRRETLEAARRIGAEATRDNRLAASTSDLIFISVKPLQLPQVIGDLRGAVNGKVVVSVVAGVTLATLRSALEEAVVYRAMPNINAVIRKSTTAIAGDRDNGYSSMVEEAFRCMGTVYWVPEEWLDAWTALVGSMPAYIALIVDSLVLGGVSSGLPRDVSMRAVLDTIIATSEHLLSRGVHPAELRDEVTTPAGVTIEGIKVIESRGVDAALIETIEASTRKAGLLGRRIDEEVRRRLSRGTPGDG